MNNKFKKVFTVLMSVLMVITMMPAMAFAETADTIEVLQGGKAVNEVSLAEGEKITLDARTDLAGEVAYQWQILADEEADLWVNIADKQKDSMVLSYALIGSLLDSDDTAEVRCTVSNGSSEAVSKPVTITVVKKSATDLTGAINAAAPAVLAAKAASYEAAPLADDETRSTYNIVINYVFENGSIAADPWTATLAAGSLFSRKVDNPVVQGYLPYVGEKQEGYVDLNYDEGISQDVTINVVYKPTNVDYTVIHYQQNVDNDQYTEVSRETKQGLTNSAVPDVAKTYEGFYALLYEKPAIAADGSTVVEVYYDRYYYLMNFDLDGGYGVEPIYARFGSTIGDVGTPTKAGYTFTGWSLDNGATNVSIPGTMPAENRTYKAIWTANNAAKVTVVFWGENADDEEYSYIKSSQIYVKPGTEFTYSEDGTLGCALEEHTHSIENNCYDLICTKEKHVHSEKCYTCGQTEHTTHTTGCYDGVGNQQNVYTDVPDNPTDGQVIDHWYYGKLIYINGSWYKYSGSTNAGGIAPTTCHTHTESCIGCGKTGHTHSIENNCYKLTCTKTDHSHTSDCYMSGAGLDSNLWTFVKSDTVTVAADGSSVVNVYYDRTQKTLTFKYNYSNSNRYQSTETITAKWGQNISEQYKKIAQNAGSTFWSAETSGEGPYTNYFGVMPQTSATYYNRGTTGNNGTMTYWGQDQNGEYTVKLFEVTGVGGYYVTDEDRYEFQGFTYHHGTSNGSNCSGAAFYYTRNSYTLTFNDGYNDVRSETVKYEASLSSYSDYVPAAPSAYEPGSVVFEGWYLNPECTGVKYDLKSHTMPAYNILLYAKWVPVTHTVEFYLDKAALDAGTKLSTHSDVTVSHGDMVEPTPADPTNGSYTFVGWFYMEDGVEKAFDFANMPVRKDLKVYGKWSSNVLKEYTIYYKLQDTDTQIAAPTTGSGLAGITKTFEAKGGTDLYEDYQEGYFPIAKSHSMTLDINATEEHDTNVYTFWYVQKEAVPYTVKYLNKETGEPVAAEKTVSDNRKAVVTETFVPVSGMMPDAYQKRLVVSAEEGAVNEIIFYYVEDTVHAYYKITHYTENLGTDASGSPTWTEYASSQAVGDIGTTYSADPMTIPGFTYDSLVPGTVKSGELTAAGLELKLYYTRNSYPYQVRYLEQGTGKVLADPKNGSELYGKVVSETAKPISDYTVVAPESQTLNIRIEEGSEAKLNIITFYYTENEVEIKYEVKDGIGGTVSRSLEKIKIISGAAQGSEASAETDYNFVGWYDETGNLVSEDLMFVPEKVEGKNVAATYYAKFAEKQVTINYQTVGPVGSGTVSPESETLNILSGRAGGSKATANDNYHFVGWYTDAECTQPVNSSLVDADNRFVPAKVDGKNVAATYYAKFAENEATINYEVVGPARCGSVSPESESLKVLTGAAEGSTAAASGPNFKFVGWYTDAECTQPVDSSQVDADNKFVPVKADGAAWVDGTTYYAKFEYALAPLTITKSGAADVDENQSFIFRIVGTDDNTSGIDMNVVVHGNGSATIKDLPIGDYTVTEDTTWSWRYAPAENDKSITVSAIEGDHTENKVTFTNNRNKLFWLSGDCFNDNRFTIKSIS